VCLYEKISEAWISYVQVKLIIKCKSLGKFLLITTT